MQLACRQFTGDLWDEEKPDVILIHGTGGDGSLWESQVGLLTREGYRCLVPELRGHGLTHDPEEHTDLEVHVADVLETLEACGARYPAIFIGHSLGAIISLQLAQDRPELFQQVLAVSLPGKVPPLVSTLFTWFLCMPFEAVRGTVLHKSLPIRYRILIDTERHSLEQIVEHFSKISLVDRVHQIQCPVHLSVGRCDVVAPYIYVKKIHQALPNSTLKIFEWAGHSCMDDRPGEFNDWLMEKIRNGSGAAARTGSARAGAAGLADQTVRTSPSA